MSSRFTIFLLSLDNLPGFDESYEKLINAIADRGKVQRSTTTGSAVRYLTDNSPSAVIITDAGITEKANREVLEKLKAYISNGGTAIFGCNFSSFISPPNMEKLWSLAFDLPWKAGDYTREEVHLNDQVKTKLKSSAESLK